MVQSFDPVSNYRKLYEDHGINFDCIQNVVSLCPNCRKLIHYGMQEVIVNTLFKLERSGLAEIGLENLSVEELYKLCKISSTD